jgi:TRAP-type C4-dicarboxylate transport system permease small subunit
MKINERITQIEWVVGAALLTVIVFLVFIASVMRFLGFPIIWSVDLAQLLFIWLCFVGATKAMRERGHLGVDLLVRRFSFRVRFTIEVVMAILFVAFMIVLAIEGYKLSLLNRERVFGDSGMSYLYVTIAVPVGCLFLSLAIIANLLEAWKERLSGSTLIFTRLKKPSEQP